MSDCEVSWSEVMADFFPNEDMDTPEGMDDIGEALMGMYSDD
jgi:hypothetical protein